MVKITVKNYMVGDLLYALNNNDSVSKVDIFTGETYTDFEICHYDRETCEDIINGYLRGIEDGLGDGLGTGVDEEHSCENCDVNAVQKANGKSCHYHCIHHPKTKDFWVKIGKK